VLRFFDLEFVWILVVGTWNLFRWVARLLGGWVAPMLKNKWPRGLFMFLSVKVITIFTQQAKRKQALLESNLPGIVCSTGMVKEVAVIYFNLFLFITFQEYMPSKNSFMSSSNKRTSSYQQCKCLHFSDQL
jgi:hypothetical protein